MRDHAGYVAYQTIAIGFGRTDEIKYCSCIGFASQSPNGCCEYNKQHCSLNNDTSPQVRLINWILLTGSGDETIPVTGAPQGKLDILL